MCCLQRLLLPSLTVGGGMQPEHDWLSSQLIRFSLQQANCINPELPSLPCCRVQQVLVWTHDPGIQGQQVITIAARRPDHILQKWRVSAQGSKHLGLLAASVFASLLHQLNL